MSGRAGPLAGLITSVGWFTRFPGGMPVQGPELGAAVAWLPVVGLLMAGVGVAVRVSTIDPLGGLASAVLTVGATVAATGAYHEDGLADTLDGIWGGSTPERRLEIMRDPRLGTYGASALVLTLLLRVAILAPLGPADSARALLVGHVVGRGTAAPMLRWLPSARAEGAAASLDVVPSRALVSAVGVPVATAVAAVGAWAPVPLFLAAGSAALLGAVARRRLGGITGDVLGAANQLAHVTAMATVAAVVS